MRVEPHGVDSYVHVVKRGARGMAITRDENDRKRFRRLLYYLNDEFQSEFWETALTKRDSLERPKNWPAREPLVHVVAWTLMPNHFHLILKEIKDGGIARYMQRVGGSMTRHFNEKYGEQGSIFQGAYKCRTIATDRYMRWALSYVMVKNVFELYPGGLSEAVSKFDRAWKWAGKYEYSSFGDFAAGNPSPILEPGSFADFFRSADEFKSLSRDMVKSRLDQLRSLPEIVLE